MRAGAHQSRTNRRDIDPVLGQLRSHSLGQTNQSKFAGSIGQQVRNGDFAADGCDVDNTAMALTFHVRNDLSHQVKWTPKVDCHRFSKILELHMLRWTDLDNAGNIDQNVDSFEFADDGVYI